MATEFNIDQLSVKIYQDQYQLGQAAAALAEHYLHKAIAEKDKVTIILATGASQFEFLAALTAKKIDWKKVIAFHLDEYVGLPENHPASFRRYLRQRIIDKVGVGTFYPVEGDKPDPQSECDRIGRILEQHPVDVAFVGIGENGHLAFNDPPASFDDVVNYKIVELDDKCRNQQLGEGWFTSIDAVPRQAITMTIPAIMKSKAIICSVPDKRKADAVKNTLTFAIAPEFPASILRKHPQATLFLDHAAASLLNSV